MESISQSLTGGLQACVGHPQPECVRDPQTGLQTQNRDNMADIQAGGMAYAGKLVYERLGKTPLYNRVGLLVSKEIQTWGTWTTFQGHKECETQNLFKAILHLGRTLSIICSSKY